MNACSDYEIELHKKSALSLANHYWNLYMKEVNHTAKAAKRIHDRGRQVLDNIKPGPCSVCAQLKTQMDKAINRIIELENEKWLAREYRRKKWTSFFSSIARSTLRSLSWPVRFVTRALR